MDRVEDRADIDDKPQASTIGDLEAGSGETSKDPSRAPAKLFALKKGDMFIVADGHGDVVGQGDGLFRDDTRVLSRFTLTLAGRQPNPLASQLSPDNVLFTAHMTNRPLPPLGGKSLPEGVIHIERQRFLLAGRLFERVTLTNFAVRPTQVPLEIALGADFADIFEVRGMKRDTRGDLERPRISAQSIELAYRGKDDVERRSVVSFSEKPQKIDAHGARFLVDLAREEVRALYLEIGSEAGPVPSRARYRDALAKARREMRGTLQRGAALRSSNPVYNHWLEKSRADLALLTTELPTGPYPYAGIPWFSTPFGRDGIITALQVLWLDPSLARGVLAYLAAHQATDYSAFRDSAPGKIMHETRHGEMARLNEIPFGLYYGGVDTTPLFVMLAGAYAERTGDLAFIGDIWPSLEAAMRWVETDGDSNGDGFLDYQRGAKTGLANQGWKDSNDSVFHADGTDPASPIALVEVQGYVFAAYQAMATLCGLRNASDEAQVWRQKALALGEKIENTFWIDGRNFYAIALDGAGRRCAVRSSNPGHLLYAGVPSKERARAVIDNFLSARFSNGFGLRTLGSAQARYNPMSYHNGSVWPHDTALAIAGMGRYGERDGVVRLLTDMFDAAVRFDMRLPELFCGFPRQGGGDSPVGYPVACMPQAWASGAAFMALQACLGVSINYRTGLRIEKPRLPPGVDHLEIRRLDVRGKAVKLTFQRIGTGVVAYSDQHLGGAVPIAGVEQ